MIPVTEPHPTPRLGHGEFIALCALMMSLVALSIDAMLPALAEIGDDLGVAHANDTQFIVSALFLGLACAQFLFGPLSDSIGRKSAIYLGLALFAAGTLLSLFATSMAVMLVGRVLQGIGAAGPRIVTMALVRDLYAGRDMARIMSLIMSVFIMVPVFAPVVGQGILMVAHWRWIFGMFLSLAIIGFVWFAARQIETLPAALRRPFSVAVIFAGVRETCRSPTALGYTIAAGIVFGAFIGYLVSSRQVFQDTYGVGDAFALYFAAIALSIGAASIVNARLVMRFGMRRLSRYASIVLCAISIPYAAAGWMLGADLPLWVLMIDFVVVFFCFGMLIGNFNALAMEPLGHIAGIAAAVIGALTTFMCLGLGTVIGRFYDGTATPLLVGFAVLGVASLIVMIIAGRAEGGLDT
jgi:DHA1 family bicyclomycin/chloramphenicol resistance-like MFS transporter